MKEQEQYVKVLQHVIEATQENKIKTTDELMKTLIHELRNTVTGKEKQHNVSSSSFLY